MKTAPIALFVYNRPWHTRQAIEALQKNELASESDLIVYSDGLKEANRSQVIAQISNNPVQQVREYVRTIKGFKSIRIVEREKNIGLANSIITGVTEVVNQYAKIIVLEDDMLTSPFFLRYMNDGLELYEKEEKVISIHGYVYPIKNLPETFFIKGADCWGWSTWKRGWDLFEADGRKLLQALKEKNLLKRFDFEGAYPYTKMLRDQIKGKNDSWAIRWYASALLQNKLTLYPGRSLLKNIGTDSSGTHNDRTDIFKVDLTEQQINLRDTNIRENLNAYSEFRSFLIKVSKDFTGINRIRRFIKRKLKI